MAVDINDVLVKVQNLLNVEGRTPEEAASYVAKAHELLAKWDLTIESVHNLKADARTAIRESAASREVSGKPDGWKSDLLEEIAALFDCRVLWTSSYEEYTTKRGGTRDRYVRVGNLIGFGHDVEAAGYAHAFLVGEITRLAKEYARTHWDAIKELAREKGWSNHDAESVYVGRTGTHPLKAELTFIKGATQTASESVRTEIRRRNVERREQAEYNPNALVIQKGKEVEDFAYRRTHGGLSKEEYETKYYGTPEEREARRAAREREMAAEAARKAEERAKETPKERERREAREAREEAKRSERESREYAKWQQREWQRQMREARNTDHDALYAGQAAGRTIKVRRGIGGGNDTEAIG